MFFYADFKIFYLFSPILLLTYIIGLDIMKSRFYSQFITVRMVPDSHEKKHKKISEFVPLEIKHRI